MVQPQSGHQAYAASACSYSSDAYSRQVPNKHIVSDSIHGLLVIVGFEEMSVAIRGDLKTLWPAKVWTAFYTT